MKRNLLIIARTCTRVNMLHDTGTGRYIKAPKHMIVNVCLSSLVNSINQVKDHTIKLVVLDDHSTTDAIDNIKQILSTCKFPYELVEINDGTGPKHTMKKVYEQVENYATDLWYHVEDDYLHVPDAIQDMIDSVTTFEINTGKMIAVNPHDDIWRYFREIYPSFILLGPNRHYRTVCHTTYTCLASKKIYNTYKNHFQDAANFIMIKDENSTINHVWNKEDVFLFSPIPGVAFHLMDESGKDPYFDIMNLWNSTPKLWIK